jgi:uracil-DNA glycosylase family 4
MIGRRGRIQLEIDQLRDPKCKLCSLHKSAVHVCIMNRGSVTAPIVCVGEAPGENEANTGKPFMGLAGMYLDEILEELEMKHMCYITNFVKCRPPGNRQPKPPELRVCTDAFFEYEMGIIKPKVIVSMCRLGIMYFMNTGALKSSPKIKPFNGNSRVSFERFVLMPNEGKHEWWGCPVVLGWHPSYIRRSGFRPDLVDEFKSQFTIARDYVYEMQGRKTP